MSCKRIRVSPRRKVGEHPNRNVPAWLGFEAPGRGQREQPHRRLRATQRSKARARPVSFFATFLKRFKIFRLFGSQARSSYWPHQEWKFTQMDSIIDTDTWVPKPTWCCSRNSVAPTPVYFAPCNNYHMPFQMCAGTGIETHNRAGTETLRMLFKLIRQSLQDPKVDHQYGLFIMMSMSFVMIFWAFVYY